MTVSINGTSGVTFNDASTQNTAATGFGFKNRIINGAMMIDQRNAGASGTAIGVYTVDRWVYVASTTSKLTWQQNAGSVTPPVGFVNYLGVTSSSSYSVPSGEVYEIEQRIEGLNVSDFGWGTANATTVTLSFWVRSSLTGTFGGALTNSAGNRSYPFSYTISSANTWEQKSVTIAGDTTGTWLTTNGVGIIVRISVGAGSSVSGTAGSWSANNFYSATGATSVVGTNGATFYITGVQLEKGSTATSFDYRPYGTELALCQRYFVRDLQDGSQATFLVGVIENSTRGDRCGMRFPVTMRATPTAAIGGTANPRLYDGGAAPTITSIASNSSSSFGACLAFNATGGGLTIGRAAVVIDNNASFITYSAEL